MAARRPRDVLLRLKWTEGESLDEAEVWYRHRGAPKDEAVLHGDQIRSLGRSFIETREASIPYHRILRIRYRGQTIFERHARGSPTSRTARR